MTTPVNFIVKIVNPKTRLLEDVLISIQDTKLIIAPYEYKDLTISNEMIFANKIEFPGG